MAKAKAKTKAQCQRQHAKNRAFQRFGAELNRNDLREVVDLIQTGKAAHIERQSQRVSVFRVFVTKFNQDAYAVYDRSRNEVVTFLTDEMVKENFMRRMAEDEAEEERARERKRVQVLSRAALTQSDFTLASKLIRDGKYRIRSEIDQQFSHYVVGLTKHGVFLGAFTFLYDEVAKTVVEEVKQ